MTKWHCSRCGAANPDWTNWCNECSTSRDEVLATAPLPSSPPGPSAGRRAPVIAIVVAVAVIAAAAGAFALTRGRDSKNASATSSSSAAPPTTLKRHRSADEIAADDAAAHAAVLTATDLLGWGAKSSNPAPVVSPHRLALDPDTTACFAGGSSTLSDNPTEIAGDDLADDQSRLVTSEITIYVNDHDAKSDLAQLKKSTLKDCLTSLLDRELTESLGSKTLPSEVHFGAAVASTLDIGATRGDDVYAIRALIPVQVAQFSGRSQVDLVYVRKGRTIVSMAFFTFHDAIPIDVEATATNAVVDRVPA